VTRIPPYLIAEVILEVADSGTRLTEAGN